MLVETSEYCSLPFVSYNYLDDMVCLQSLSYLKGRNGIHTWYELILIYSGTKESKLYLKFYHIQMVLHVNGVLPLSVRYEADLLRQNLSCIS